jgi:(heptosyl)LPS beta-1,4-glucosyltransferase
VLIVDVDERLSVELANEIRTTLDRRTQFDGFQLCRHNYFLGHRVRFGGWGRERIIRLFRRDLFRYANEQADHGEFPTSDRKIGRLRHPIKHLTRRSYADDVEKCERYSQLQAEQWYRAGRRPSFAKLLLTAPLRFLRSYVLYGGFLDGPVGVQIAFNTANAAYMKQARLWELHYGQRSACLRDDHERHVLSLPTADALHESVEPMRRAA